MKKTLKDLINDLSGEYTFDFGKKINKSDSGSDLEIKFKCNYPNLSHIIETGYAKIRHYKIECKKLKKYITENNLVNKISKNIKLNKSIYRILSFSPSIKKRNAIC
jgi:hypothetical protein